MSLGDRLKQTRKAMGLSQEALAQRVGCARSLLSMIETGEVQDPSAHDMARAAEILGVDLKWLITGKNSTNASVTKLGRDVWDTYVELSPGHQAIVRDLIMSLGKPPPTADETGKHKRAR